MSFAGFGVGVAHFVGKGEGTSEDILEGFSDGKLYSAKDEFGFLPNGKTTTMNNVCEWLCVCMHPHEK